jgi:hypothetical protein
MHGYVRHIMNVSLLQTQGNGGGGSKILRASTHIAGPRCPAAKPLVTAKWIRYGFILTERLAAEFCRRVIIRR